MFGQLAVDAEPLGRLPSPLNNQQRRSEPNRAVPVRARALGGNWTDSHRPSAGPRACAGGSVRLCSAAEGRRGTVGTTTFAANHASEQVRTEPVMFGQPAVDAEPLGRPPSPLNNQQRRSKPNRAVPVRARAQRPTTFAAKQPTAPIKAEQSRARQGAGAQRALTRQLAARVATTAQTRVVRARARSEKGTNSRRPRACARGLTPGGSVRHVRQPRVDALGRT